MSMDFTVVILILAILGISLGFVRVFYSIFTGMAKCIFMPGDLQLQMIETRLSYLRTRLEELEEIKQ